MKSVSIFFLQKKTFHPRTRILACLFTWENWSQNSSTEVRRFEKFKNLGIFTRSLIIYTANFNQRKIWHPINLFSHFCDVLFYTQGSRIFFCDIFYYTFFVRAACSEKWKLSPMRHLWFLTSTSNNFDSSLEISAPSDLYEQQTIASITIFKLHFFLTVLTLRDAKYLNTTNIARQN